MDESATIPASRPAEEAQVHATVGDRLVVHGAHVDDVNREGEIVEVRGKDGAPPYVVRWSDTGQEGFVFPGPDATVHHPGRASGDVSAGP